MHAYPYEYSDSQRNLNHGQKFHAKITKRSGLNHCVFVFIGFSDLFHQLQQDMIEDATTGKIGDLLLRIKAADHLYILLRSVGTGQGQG